ncbi:MAG: type IV pilin [Methanobacteriota archaeon]|nr:MAG: type IV pilin [Euryarchaeota archaeon]
MKIVLRDDESGVSEVVGTILILAMTVVLFSSIILWVGSIPTPTTQTRVDLRPSMIPVYRLAPTRVDERRHLGRAGLGLGHRGALDLRELQPSVLRSDLGPRGRRHEEPRPMERADHRPCRDPPARVRGEVDGRFVGHLGHRSHPGDAGLHPVRPGD